LFPAPAKDWKLFLLLYLLPNAPGFLYPAAAAAAAVDEDEDEAKPEEVAKEEEEEKLELMLSPPV